MSTAAFGLVKHLARKVRGLARLYHAAFLDLSRGLTRVRWLLQRMYYSLDRSAVPPPAYYVQFVRSTLPAARPSPIKGKDVGVRTNPDGSRDFSGYNEDNFLDVPRYENYDYLNGRVRKEDMGCAALYAFGIESFQEAQVIFPETHFEAQVEAVQRAVRRQPRYVADIGCGLGSLTALFLATGLQVDAIDPAPIAQDKIRNTIERFTKKPIEKFGSRFRFCHAPLAAYVDSLRHSPNFPDSFVLVESIEHIPKEEMLWALQALKDHGNCLLIITSVVDYHPIEPDGTGWNHVTRVDDAYYEELSSFAKRRVLRAGSHLVLRF
jgi:SAM-dependent methyltransferase